MVADSDAQAIPMHARHAILQSIRQVRFRAKNLVLVSEKPRGRVFQQPLT